MPGSIAEDEEEDGFKVTDHGSEVEVEGDLSDEARLEAMKLAVDETLQSIKTRLAIVLENAGQLDQFRDFSSPSTLSPRHSASHSLSSPCSSSRQSILFSEAGTRVHPFTPLRPDSPPPTAVLPDAAGLDEMMASLLPTLVKPHNPKRFTPKRLTLTPPVSPENIKHHHSKPSSSSRRGHHLSSSIASIATNDSTATDSPTSTIRSFSDARADSPEQFRSKSRNLGRGREGYGCAPSESRASNYDDDSQSFVSAESYDSSAFNSDEDVEEGNSFVDSRRTEIPGSPSGSVELFTRAGSVLGGNYRKESAGNGSLGLEQGGLRPDLASSGVPRPISTATVRPPSSQD